MAQTMALQSEDASVSLHPLASRDGQQSSTIVEVQVPSPKVISTVDQLPVLSNSNNDLQDSHMAGDSSAFSTAKEESRIWGLTHEDIDQYPIVDDNPALYSALDEAGHTHIFPIDDAPPIRAMTVEQFAKLHAQYNSLDVPHSVVFPFMHGVDGSNLAQNIFFKAPATGQSAPNYRGLTVVRADLPDPRQQEQERNRQSQLRRLRSSSSASAFAHSSSRSRADSATSSSSGSHPSHSHRGSCVSAPDARQSSSDHSTGVSKQDASVSITASSSSASVSSSMASSDHSAPSLFSDNFGDTNSSAEDHTDTSNTSVNISHAGDHNFEKGSPSPLSNMRQCQSSYDPQPDHSLLNSSFYPCELIRPPIFANKKSMTKYLAVSSSPPGQNDALLQTAAFYQPAQPRGVNLRNFKIQAAKYATVSDIVIYCPAGFHDGVLRMARWFREAHEASWQERQERELGGLRYNVFIVAEPFEEFERSTPHLVAVDQRGYSRNRVDFVDREREEMQRLTAASPLDANVWLGCTADVPSFGDDEEAEDTVNTQWAAESNPHGFSICVECHDTAEVPDNGKLAHASHYLDAVEATTLFDVNSKQALRDFDEEERAWSDGSDVGTTAGPASAKSASHLSLGPSGWTPTLPSRLQIGSLRRKASSSSTSKLPLETEHAALEPHIVPSGSNIVQLECSSLTSFMTNDTGDSHGNSDTDAHLSRVADSVINLCAWIRSQTRPMAAVSATQQQSSGILSGAFRSVHQHGRSNGGSQSTPGSPQKQRPSNTVALGTSRRQPRRVLIHCGDGYTESSILALTYLMYVHGHSLPEAYLHLQNKSNRSFFVFAKDLPFIKRIEQHVMLARRRDAEQLEATIERPRVKHSFSWLGADDKDGRRRIGSNGRRGSNSSPQHEAASEQSVWVRSLHGLVSAASGGSSQLKKAPSNGGLTSRIDAPPSRALTPTPKTVRGNSVSKQQQYERQRQQQEIQHAWFYDRRFEGSFPSRILPFLYLGNLNHALNPAMLHALGITHVVSVGESALHPPISSVATTLKGSPSSERQHFPDAPEPEGQNSLWHEHEAGRISVLDLKNVCDDGIDPLRSTMRDAVEYIENARCQGGRVLVHCRVGVSRSTTIVLAYVMAHLDMSLIESYLMVRSRRLSILIQPHLLFFWELRGWETYLATQKVKRAAKQALRNRPDQGEGTDVPVCLEGQDHQTITLASLSISNHFDGQQLSQKAASILQQTAGAGSACGFHKPQSSFPSEVDSSSGNNEDNNDLAVEIGAGAGSPYNFQVSGVDRRPFGSGSPSGISAQSLRLSWGYLCREIAALNERYF